MNQVSPIAVEQQTNPVSNNGAAQGNITPVAGIELWQNKILPFAIILLSALVLVFVILYTLEARNIQRSFLQNSNYDIFHVSEVLNKPGMAMQDKMYNAEMISLLNRHYHASLIVKSRILTLNLSFLTGMILCFMGGVFVLGKFSETTTAVSAGDGARYVGFTSASPGISLSLLGVFLIAISIFSKTSLDVKDLPSYVSRLDNSRPGINGAIPGEIPIINVVPDSSKGRKADTNVLGRLRNLTR